MGLTGRTSAAIVGVRSYFGGVVKLSKLLVTSGRAADAAHASYLLTLGAVFVEGERVTDPDFEVTQNSGIIIKLGPLFAFRS